MKRKFAGCILLLMSLNLASLNVLAQEQIDTVDVLKLKEGDKTKAVDFTKGFSIVFINNDTGSKVEISILKNVEFVSLKKSIKKSEAAKIRFDFTLSGRMLSVRQSGIEIEKISPSDSIQVHYKFNDGHTIEFIIPKIIGSGNEATINNNNANVGSSSNHFTGIELHDAILAKKYYGNNDPRLYTLLAEIKNVENDNPKTIDSLYQNNPFIHDLLMSNLELKKKAELTTIQGGFVSNIFTKVLNTDVTTFADGLARFLVKRTKEELNVAFFQHFKDLINSDKYKDAQILFPVTMETLNTIDQEIYQFENYITTLREAFEKDLSLLLENLPRVIEEGRWSDSLSLPKNTNLKYSLLLTLFTAKELLAGVHPGKVLETLPDEYIYEFLIPRTSDKDKNISGAFKTAQLISASLRSRDNNRYWSTTDSIQMLYKNDSNLIAAKFYLGFLYEKGRDISFQDKTLSVYLDSLSKLEPSIKKCIVFVKELGMKYQAVESAIAQIKLKLPETPSIDIYNRLFKSFADALDNVLDIDKLPGIKIDPKVKIAVEKYINLFREGNDLALNVVRKNYGSAIVNTYNIYLTFADTLGLSKKEYEIATKVTEFIKKYGTFMANTVKAKSSEEVAAAIEAVALPVGSASIKRQTDFNIALNAYVGLFLGSENIKGVDDGWKLNSYGVTAPIGISISFRNSRKSSKRSSSSSLFFSIIDLGAPVSFRFKDDKTEEVPSIEFKDIISPGVFYSYGIPRVPISVNVGWQLGPLLREVDPLYTPGETYSRISLSIVVDIPLLNFYTKNK